MDEKQIPIMRWDNWPDHPTWKTERQHTQEGLIPGGDAVARVWYGNKYMKRRGEAGYYILLFDTALATPKPVTDSKKAALAKAKATALANRTCAVCQRDNGRKIKRTPPLCDSCYSLQAEVTDARKWLESDSVILDTETTGLDGEIIQIAVIDMAGKVLLNTYVKPEQPIDERLYDEGEDWDGNPVEVPTAFAINGIGNDMVKDAPTFPEMWQLLKLILKDKRVICYNAEFDFGRLRSGLDQHGITDEIDGEWDCIMLWYADYHSEYSYRYRSNKWMRLVEACHEQNVVVHGHHTGDGDCQLTLALIKAIADKRAPLDVEK